MAVRSLYVKHFRQFFFFFLLDVICTGADLITLKYTVWFYKDKDMKIKTENSPASWHILCICNEGQQLFNESLLITEHLVFVIDLLLYCRCLHGDPSGRILLNLCSSLLFLNVSFLMASQVNTLQVKYNETSAETLCIIVAILIHYFLLTTLAWMCVEAINMYQMLVTVFNIYHSRFMLKRVLAAWG